MFSSTSCLLQELIRCPQVPPPSEFVVKTHDVEYRFEDKMPTPPASKYDKWRKMTFGKGDSTFVSDSRVKLPYMKPNVYGVINYFRTEVKMSL